MRDLRNRCLERFRYGFVCFVPAKRIFPGDERLVSVSLRCSDFSTHGAAVSRSPGSARDREGGGWVRVCLRGGQGRGLGACALARRPARRVVGPAPRRYRGPIPYLRNRMAMAVCEVCRRAASRRLDG